MTTKKKESKLSPTEQAYLNMFKQQLEGDWSLALEKRLIGDMKTNPKLRSFLSKATPDQIQAWSNMISILAPIMETDMDIGTTTH